MITVFQCDKCKTIVGDTNVPVLAAEDSIEVTHAVGVLRTRNQRLRCEACDEVIGTEDEEGKYFYNVKAVRRYPVQSTNVPLEPESQGGSKKRIRQDSDEAYVPLKAFEKFRQEYLKDVAEIKEALLKMYDINDLR